MELVSVVLGAANSNDRFNGARKMLDHGFANWSKVSVDIDDDIMENIPVKKGMAPSVPIKVEKMGSILVARGREQDVVQDIDVQSEIEAPVAEGQKVGQVRLILDEEEIGCVDILAAVAVEKISFGKALGRLLHSLFIS